MSEAITSFDDHDEKKVLRAVCKIKTAEGASGTGFLVKDQRHVLTARHVVEDSIKKQAVIVSIDNKEYYASILSDLVEWDVALLLLDTPVEGIEPLTLAPEKLVPGALIRSYGFPETFNAGWYNGSIAGLSSDGKKYDIDFNQDYGSQLVGLSGGPVFFHNKYSVIAFVCEHPYPAKGKIVPVEGFYNKSFLEAQESAEEPWCYVVLSEADKRESEADHYTLQVAVKRAMNLLRKVPLVEKDVKPPEFKYATELVYNSDSYQEAVKQICRAKIAIFDITHFEPAVMLFLGIRSVVRRGVTIASYGENYVIGDAIDLPFNLQEINIISHSAEQNKKGDQGDIENTPHYIIRDRIRDGIKHLKMPQYLDLPTFDAIRNLPPKYREPDNDNVLVLCSYSEKYEDTNWKKLWLGLKEQLDSRTGGRFGPRIMRVRDLMSPRLVSHTIYEHIRRKVLCIVDWTEWRPNVFFELGVRLAVTNDTGYTICIVEDKNIQVLEEINQYLENIQNDTDQIEKSISILAGIDANDPKFVSIKDFYIQIAPQCQRLLKLFNPLPYTRIHPDDNQSQYEKMMHYYAAQKETRVAFRDMIGRVPEDTYKVIEANIDTDEEITTIPVYLELFRTADLFGVEDSEGQAAVLYPNNETLRKKVEIGVTQRLLAAWYFIRNEYSNKEIVKDPELFGVCQDIGPILSRRLKESNPPLAEEIRDTIRFLPLLEEWYSMSKKYTDQQIIKDSTLFATCRDLESKLSRLLNDLKSRSSSHPKGSKPKLLSEINDIMQSLKSLLRQKGG